MEELSVTRYADELCGGKLEKVQAESSKEVHLERLLMKVKEGSGRAGLHLRSRTAIVTTEETRL